jgi:hypothetical protein
MKWQTGNHSYNELIQLMGNLKYFKYFPILDSMIDNTDTLRIGYGDPAKITLSQADWETLDKTVDVLAKSLSFLAHISVGIKFQAIPLGDLTVEHFKNAQILEDGLLKIFADFELLPSEPPDWKELGFVPDPS